MQHLHTIEVLRQLQANKVGTTIGERLALLLIVGTDESLAMTDIAKGVGMSRAALTTLTDRLVASGYVKREYEHGGDRRRVGIVATAKGRKAVERAESAVPA